MKIVCGVCLEEEASVFCCADEAALCDACDQRVHSANKVAGKHSRFSLLSAQSHPLCDVCQEKRGYLFCQDDRAILCMDCDASIHGANRFAMKHNRFLLAGVRISAVPISSPPIAEPETKTAVLVSKENTTTVADASISFSTAGISAASSSISEYLTKTCPGWRVEDLLVDEAAAAMVDFTMGNGSLPFPEPDGGGLHAAADKLPAWAPQVPQFPPPCLPAGTGHYHRCQGSKVAAQKQQREQAFTVPQISPASAPNKRPRHSLCYY